MTSPAEIGHFDQAVGERVHLLMWRMGHTQAEIGKLVGIDQSLLSKKLRGNARWYGGELAAIAHVLHTTIGYLVGETATPRLPRLDSNQQPSG